MVSTQETLTSSPVNAAADGKRSLAGLTRDGLKAALIEIGVPEKQLRMRVNQLWSWIYVRGLTSFDDMSDVSKDLRRALDARFTLARPEIVAEQVSVDGTRKWLLRLPKRGHETRAPEIETVYIPESDRGTLCISSQVGCTLNCTFCHTGTQRLVRNLEAEEIVGQILLARDCIGRSVLQSMMVHRSTPAKLMSHIDVAPYKTRTGTRRRNAKAWRRRLISRRRWPSEIRRGGRVWRLARRSIGQAGMYA